MAEPKPSLLRTVLSIPAEIVVGLYVVIDGIVSPLFRPLVRWLSSLQLVKRLELSIGSMPPYVLLGLLVVPFGFAEIAKVYALIIMGEGHFRSGMTMFIMAYVVSILVCERIFHAGKAQLLTIPWFAKLYGWVMMIRDHLLAWFRTTWIWAKAMELRQSMRLATRRLKDRVRATFGMKRKGFFERQ